ncbi:hypothetical protein [Paraflavitalea speifideaquila]|uniref:hypothetical protein n=1 Tax=Paraflavitalea speifideaquila TaxID=3076558 RepID=UPI0028EEB0CA|nr:hypothetical protein [Paraflavitalea speifideiaquila]
MNDFSSNSYFVVLHVKLSEGVVISTIQNDDLFHYFNKTKGYDENRYKSEIGSMLKENKQLTITNADFLAFGFTKVVDGPKIIREARKGKDIVLNKYFNSQVIKEGVSNDEKGVLIRVLFEWSIPASIDDETGYLVIDTK